ncbi:type II secretion system protein N [Halorhodospira halophila]|uniref:Type II secretion system protein N n=1 Tax=Halorhodospira halophila (strain DSM 244 / SL1) TaxID=349124 RepID=A1WXC7_HALHL|nr:type II secretion system protein N [Halorhodospira halophila]ABM62339.1 type II secretion system protein N [Halorhodospira halophila SL1]MBK1730060.1 type II secretion system protein N [Halorhodospira halophila]
MRKLVITVLLLLGLVAGTVYAVGHIPAGSAWNAAERHLPVPAAWGRAEVEGSLRAGRVQRLEIPRLWGVDPGTLDVAWEVQGRSLVAGRLKVDLDGSLDDARFQGVATRSAGGWQVSEGSGEVSMDRLRQMASQRGVELPPVSGTVAYQIDRLSLSNDGELRSVEGRVTGRDLTVTHEGERLDLGSVVSSVSSSDNRAYGEVHDQGGPVALDGQWQVSRDGSYHLDATVTTREGADPALRDWLAQYAEPDGDGFRVRESGRR